MNVGDFPRIPSKRQQNKTESTQTSTQSKAEDSLVESLNQQLDDVRDLFATPHENLGKARGTASRASHKAYEQAQTTSAEAEGLALAQKSVAILAEFTSLGGLSQLQEAALSLAAETSANPLSGLALSTRMSLDSLGGQASPESDWALEGAVKLAGAMGPDSQLATDSLLSTVQAEFHSGETPAPKGTDAKSLLAWSDSLLSESQLREQEAKLEAEEAQAFGDEAESVNAELQAHWRNNRAPSSRHHRIRQAKEFVQALELADQKKPGILKEMHQNVADDVKPFIPSGVLNSYRAQLKRHGGDPDKVNWDKILKQLERTSFG